MASPDRKRKILELHGFRCVYCGELCRPEDLTVDHVEPRVKGGDHSEGNLVACCRPCNRDKAGAAAWSFLATRPDQRSNFLRYARWIWPRLRRAVEESVQ
ncbi:MAG TPA: HNH endonuclease signature motif containing protein [Longimicrobiales bacterium]|nr:HNH endonuclease signature motif containing protein [Longimicrobiales bacterium]